LKAGRYKNMTIREKLEQQEFKILSKYATKSAEAKPRKIPIKKCDIRTDFQRDRDRITHCKAFRRLMHKTQVFISPEGDHYRTRLTHTLEVAQIARTIALALNLNQDLTEAIALGHDLGHTPFGHTGEDALNDLLPNGFKHNLQSERVVEYLENEGRGLNLTPEVTDGIKNHRMSCKPSTIEGQVVRLCDKIAYMNHDVDDALRAKILKPSDLPPFAGIGEATNKRIDFMVLNLIENSMDKPVISFTPEVEAEIKSLRIFLREKVYTNQRLHEMERSKIKTMLELLFNHYLENPHKLPSELSVRMNENPKQTVADYIAGMTDRFAMKSFKEIFLPSAWEAE